MKSQNVQALQGASAKPTPPVAIEFLPDIQTEIRRAFEMATAIERAIQNDEEEYSEVQITSLGSSESLHKCLAIVADRGPNNARVEILIHNQDRVIRITSAALGGLRIEISPFLGDVNSKARIRSILNVAADALDRPPYTEVNGETCFESIDGELVSLLVLEILDAARIDPIRHQLRACLFTKRRSA